MIPSVSKQGCTEKRIPCVVPITAISLHGASEDIGAIPDVNSCKFLSQISLCPSYKVSLFSLVDLGGQPLRSYRCLVIFPLEVIYELLEQFLPTTSVFVLIWPMSKVLNRTLLVSDICGCVKGVVSAAQKFRSPDSQLLGIYSKQELHNVYYTHSEYKCWSIVT